MSSYLLVYSMSQLTIQTYGNFMWGRAIAKKCVYVFALTQRNGLRASVSQYISLIVKNTYQTVQKPRITEQDTFQYIPLKILPKPSKNMQQTGGYRFSHSQITCALNWPLAMFLETLVATSIFNHLLYFSGQSRSF